MEAVGVCFSGSPLGSSGAAAEEAAWQPQRVECG